MVPYLGPILAKGKERGTGKRNRKEEQEAEKTYDGKGSC
jgi:hypothetical protein